MSDSNSRHLRKIVSSEESGLRLDKIISAWPEIGSRGKAAQLIDADRVRLNGRSTKASALPQAGEEIIVEIPEPRPSSILPYEIPLEIVYEDADVLVVNKPSGLVTHPAAGHAHDTLVNALVAHTDDLAMGFGEERPGIVHRLDKETSGLLVIAKNDRAQEALVRQFKERSIHRIYQAVVVGDLKTTSGTIQSYLARHPTERKRFASVRDPSKKIQRTESPVPAAGKWAVTDYRVLARSHGLSFVQLKLRTGRTHQIRVHLSELDHPLVGDPLYGSDRRLKSIPSAKIRAEIGSLNRFLLHARELGFEHPRTKERLDFKVEWPADILGLLHQWGFNP